MSENHWTYQSKTAITLTRSLTPDGGAGSTEIGNSLENSWLPGGGDEMASSERNYGVIVRLSLNKDAESRVRAACAALLREGNNLPAPSATATYRSDRVSYRLFADPYAHMQDVDPGGSGKYGQSKKEPERGREAQPGYASPTRNPIAPNIPCCPTRQLWGRASTAIFTGTSRWCRERSRNRAAHLRKSSSPSIDDRSDAMRPQDGAWREAARDGSQNPDARRRRYPGTRGGATSAAC